MGYWNIMPIAQEILIDTGCEKMWGTKKSWNVKNKSSLKCFLANICPPWINAATQGKSTISTFLFSHIFQNWNKNSTLTAESPRIHWYLFFETFLGWKHDLFLFCLNSICDTPNAKPGYLSLLIPGIKCTLVSSLPVKPEKSSHKLYIYKSSSKLYDPMSLSSL